MKGFIESLDRKSINQDYVYFLFNKKELVYIGSTNTITLSNRLYEHKKDKTFNQYAILPITNNENKRDIEADYILKYSPKYNTRLPKCSKYITKGKIKEFCKKNNIDFKVIEEMKHKFKKDSFYIYEEIKQKIKEAQEQK